MHGHARLGALKLVTDRCVKMREVPTYQEIGNYTI